MSLIVQNPGLQTTIQAGPRTGFRHKGVPACGPADRLSHALANRLVGNPLAAPALEITLSSASFKFEAQCVIAVTGANAEIYKNDDFVLGHEIISVNSGDTITVKPLTSGCRTYLAISGKITCSVWLGSSSTYLPAGLGGHEGRALKAGDRIEFEPASSSIRPNTLPKTPQSLRPYIGHSWMLRATIGPDANLLSSQSQNDLFATPFTLSRRANRMGAELDGKALNMAPNIPPSKPEGPDNQDSPATHMPSAAVFPGTLQCPPSGKPFLLMVDAGTTGGYPRIAQIIRADRHMLGQLRPGDRIQFRATSPQEAADILRRKTNLFKNWLGDTFELG